jgi:pimeloyl-ACP methyl ester carboxylesterase
MSDRELRTEGTIPLADGRRLGFAEFGAARGPAVLWFHGTPGSSHQVPPAARAAASRRGVRLIGVERPGYGRSTPHVYGSVRDFADDVETLADALGIDRFAVTALSGGGPYALGCAHRLRDRVVALGLLGSVAPGIGSEAVPGGLVSVAVRWQLLLPLVREPLGRVMRRAVQSFAPIAYQAAPVAVRMFLPPEDCAALTDPALRRIFVADCVRAGRRWFGGPLYDATLFARSWGFSVTDVRVPVRLWHGDADRMVPLAHAHHLMRLLPDAVLSVRPGAGHLGTLVGAGEVIESLLALWPDKLGAGAAAS